MSQENVRTLKAGLAAFNDGDWDTALQRFSEDAVWVPVLAALETQGSLYGHEEIRSAWQAQRETFGDDFRGELQDVVDLGANTLLVLITLSGRGSSSGVETGVSFAQVVTFRSGKVVRVDAYRTEAEALEAVGARE
jgi:ketosteroid isomerase-like protein